MGEVLEFEAGVQPDSTDRRDDIQEVLNCRKAMARAEEMLQELPLCQRRRARGLTRFSCPAHEGRGKSPGEYRRIPDWIGPPGCSMEEATFVPIGADRLVEAMANWERLRPPRCPPIGWCRIALLHAEFEAFAPVPRRERALGTHAGAAPAVAVRADPGAHVLRQRILRVPPRRLLRRLAGGLPAIMSGPMVPLLPGSDADRRRRRTFARPKGSLTSTTKCKGASRTSRNPVSPCTFSTGCSSVQSSPAPTSRRPLASRPSPPAECWTPFCGVPAANADRRKRPATCRSRVSQRSGHR